MKKFFAFAAALVLFGTQAFAQLSVGAGYLNSTETTVIKFDDGKNKYPQDLNGFYAGVNYNIDLGDLVGGLGIAPGAYVDFLAGKDADHDNVKYRSLEINIPLNVTYAYDLTGDFRLFAFAGPIFQFGLLNNTITTIGNETTTTKNFEEKKIGDSMTLVPARNRFNILLGGGVGFEVNENYQVILGYNHSLMNYWELSDNTKVGRSQITVGVGYRF